MEISGNLFSEIIHLLITSPGNMVYHLVVAFSIAGALQGAFFNWRSSGFPQARRTVLGLGILLFLQLFLFIISSPGLQSTLNAQVALPPLERAITLLSLIWIMWLWIFPEPSRPADLASALLSFLILLFFGISLTIWIQQQATVPFNSTTMEIIWQAVSLALIFFALVVLIIRKPNGWGMGLAMLALLFIGHSLALVFPDTRENYSGIGRMLQLASFPILLTLPQRFPASSGHPPISVPDKPIPERRR